MRRIALSCLLAGGFAAQAQENLTDLKAEVELLRKEITKAEDSSKSPIGRVDAKLDTAMYGPNAKVTTKTGKLVIGGLIQVWYQQIQNDNKGLFIPAAGNDRASPEGNELNDNDTFRIRRTELRFSMDVHENISAHIMIDPARESNIFYNPLPTFPLHNIDIPGTGAAATRFRNGVGQQAGNQIVPQLLQDAYINVHGMIPHHDFTFGQFKPPTGEEANRNSGLLDFVDRAMVTSISNVRDIGAQVHGTWWEDRFQYWVGVFNGPEGTILSDPEIVEGGNRSDDNDAKDIAVRVAIRPVWDAEKWYGRMEVGYGRTDGYRGESGNFFGDNLINGINEESTAVNRQAAWIWYRPNGPVRGLWMRGEWGSFHDKYSLRTPTQVFFETPQTAPKSVTANGFYSSIGYYMPESIFAESLKNCGGVFGRALLNMEFAFRYEQYENIATEDLVNQARGVDLFKTEAWTAGLNYYIKGRNTKIQANYIWVDEPSDGNPNRGLREVQNNVFVLNFQVMF